MELGGRYWRGGGGGCHSGRPQPGEPALIKADLLFLLYNYALHAFESKRNNLDEQTERAEAIVLVIFEPGLFS